MILQQETVPIATQDILFETDYVQSSLEIPTASRKIPMEVVSTAPEDSTLILQEDADRPILFAMEQILKVYALTAIQDTL